MFTQASHHEHQSHDSREGDDQASSMLPALPDAAAQTIEARPTTHPHVTDTRPHVTDAPAADVASTTDSSRPAADIVAPGVADAAITAPNGRHPQAPPPPTSAPPQLDPLLTKLLDNEERHTDMLDLLLAVVKAREEEEEARHSAVALPTPDPISQRAPAAQCPE